MFDNGHLRLVILQLIADKPSYGYEIIKAIEERLAGRTHQARAWFIPR